MYVARKLDYENEEFRCIPLSLNKGQEFGMLKEDIEEADEHTVVEVNFIAIPSVRSFDDRKVKEYLTFEYLRFLLLIRARMDG